MNVSIDFSHAEAPVYIRSHMAEWLAKTLYDLEPERNLHVEFSCTKVGNTPKGEDLQFKCKAMATAPWIENPVVINASGDDCWETIVDCCCDLRQKIERCRKGMRNHQNKMQFNQKAKNEHVALAH